MILFRFLQIATLSLFVMFPLPAVAQSLESAVVTLADKLGSQLQRVGAERLAIHGLSELDGSHSALGDFISEELTTSLFSVGSFDIVERKEFERVLSEHERYSSDIFNPDTIADLGNFLAIQALVTGSITSFETYIRVNARAIDVETARVFAAASVSIDRDNNIDSLIEQKARRSETAQSSTSQQSQDERDSDERRSPEENQLSQVKYKGSWFEVAPQSVVSWQDRLGVTIPLRIVNTSSIRYLISGPHFDRPYATTNLGESLSVKLEGLSTNPNGPDWIALRPGEKVTAVFKISNSNRRPISGDQLSLRGIFTINDGGTRTKKASFVLDGIEIR